VGPGDLVGGQRSREGDPEALERTEYIEADLEAIFACAIASDARVEPGVRQTGRVDDQGADSFLVDHDLVQEVGKNFCAVAKPQHVRDRATDHHAVEPSQMTLGDLKVGGNFAKHRLEVLLGHAAQVAFSQPTWAVKTHQQEDLSLIIKTYHIATGKDDVLGLGPWGCLNCPWSWSWP